jgi:MFS family permease
MSVYCCCKHGWSVWFTTVAVSFISSLSSAILAYIAVYFTPLYLQNVRGYDMITSAALLLPLVLSQVFTTLISGFAIKWTNRARPSFVAGFIVWGAGQGAQICFNETTPLGVIVVCLLLQGLGIGATIQSSTFTHTRVSEATTYDSALVLAQASGPAIDRAAVTGVRK